MTVRCRCARRLVRVDVCVLCRREEDRCKCDDLSAGPVIFTETLSDWIDWSPTIFVPLR